MKALETIGHAAEILRHAGIENPEREAELMLAHCAGTTRVGLFRDNPDVVDTVVSVMNSMIERRMRREPLQYILGYAEFSGLKLRVGPGVLIPRPETELLVEEAIANISERALRTNSVRILDLCTGSGCIALALAKAFPEASVYGIDSSETAMRYAAENARLNGISNVIFLRGSLFEPLKETMLARPSETSFDLIISNPPYVKTSELSQLQPEIRDWEPVEALDGGEDGLAFFRRIIPEAKHFVKENGVLMFEIGAGQGDAVADIAKKAGFAHTSLRKDFAGFDRIITIYGTD